MAEKHTVAMFKQIDGKRVQIGWASPVDAESRGRTFERSPGFENESLSGVSFEDDELSQKAAAEQAGREADVEVHHNTVIEPTQAELDALNGGEEETPETDVDEVPESFPQEGDEGKDSAPIQVEPNETVELNTGGAIEDVNSEEDEEAEFQRLLAEEQAEAEAAEAPQTRREARENEENS